MSNSEESFWNAVDAIRVRDPRYARPAFAFVMASLGQVVQTLPAERRRDPERRHLSGGELLEGIVALARREFGLMAPTVFAEWGVRSGTDIGQIVFDLVEAGQLSARPEDSIGDFAGHPALLDELSEGVEFGSGPARA